jgi:hypothetical protein
MLLRISMVERSDRRRWLGIATSLVLVALFVWLRWFSSLWIYRWTGFCFGIVFLLSTRVAWGKVQTQIDIAKRYDLPSRIFIVGNICSLTLGVVALRSFIQGNIYLPTGARAGSDNGLLGIVLLASALEGLYQFWLSKQDASKSDNNSATA